MKILDLKRLIAEELKIIMKERPEYDDRTGGLKSGLNPMVPYADVAANPAMATDNPKDYKKTSGKLFASDWKDWPVEAQVKFCKQNKGRPTIDANGKKMPAPGPTCREILSVNEKKAAYIKSIIIQEVEQLLREAHGLNSEDLETLKTHVESVKDDKVKKVLRHIIKSNVLVKKGKSKNLVKDKK